MVNTNILKSTDKNMLHKPKHVSQPSQQRKFRVVLIELHCCTSAVNKNFIKIFIAIHCSAVRFHLSPNQAWTPLLLLLLCYTRLSSSSFFPKSLGAIPHRTLALTATCTLLRPMRGLDPRDLFICQACLFAEALLGFVVGSHLLSSALF